MQKKIEPFLYTKHRTRCALYQLLHTNAMINQLRQHCNDTLKGLLAKGFSVSLFIRRIVVYIAIRCVVLKIFL